MADLTDLSPAVASPQRAPETYDAIVAEDAAAGRPVHVIVPEFSEHLLHGPCSWTPIVTSDGIWYPHKGDACVVVAPEGGDTWIAAWSPSADEPDAEISGTGDKHYTHDQSSPSATWTVTHNLGKRPAVTVVDSAGSEWVADVQHLSENQCRLTFASPFAGRAYCN